MARVALLCRDLLFGSKVEAALRAAGYDARNYAGSWHEWSRHEELPLER